MSSSNTNIELKVGLGFGIDQSSYAKTLNDISRLRSVLSSGNADILNLDSFNSDLKEAYATADKLENVLRSSWNNRIGQLDMTQFNKNLTLAFGSVEQLKEGLSKGGDIGKNVFNDFSRNILHSNVQLKQTSKILDDLATSMGNTIKWGITSSIFNKLTGAIQKAWDYSVQLDSSLNDIRIVTGKSADEMERFARTANTAAQNLGTSTRDFTNASLIYYQQGLNDKEVEERTAITLKTANVTGQSASEVSEQLTAVWNGYKVSAEEAELYIDKLAAVAATTASDLEELSTGMSKVASAANLMGVDIDQLNAQLATIVSVTRQAPESVGVALKTIYARMGDIEAGIDTETTLGNYTSQMAAMGINVLDAKNNLRDMGDVIEEIGSKWSDFSREEQIALSQIMAGTRQYNNLLSLFDNWDMYENALLTSSAAAGTLNEQQEIYMESVEAHLQILATEAEETYDILFDAETVNGFFDIVAAGFKMFNMHLSNISGFGGLFSPLGQLGAFGLNVFQKQAGNAIEKRLTNKEGKRSNEDRETVLQRFRNAHAAKGETVFNEKALEAEIQISERISKIQRALTEDELKELTAQQEKVGFLTQQVEQAQKYYTIAQQLREEGWLKFEGPVISIEEFELADKKLNQTATEVNTMLYEMDQKLRKAGAFIAENQKNPLNGVEADNLGYEILNSDEGPDRDLKLQKFYASKKRPEYLYIDEETKKLENQSDVLREMTVTLEMAKASLDDEAKAYADELKESLSKGYLNPEEMEKFEMIASQVETYYADRRKLLSASAQGQESMQTNLVEQHQAEIDLINDQIDNTERLKLRSLELSDAIGGLSAMYMICGQAVGAYNALTNENLSTTEKLVTVIGMGASALLTYAQNAEQIAKVGPTIVKNIYNWNKAQAQQITLDQASAMIKEKGVWVTIKETVSTLAYNIQKAIRNKLDAIGLALAQGNVLAIGALVVATAALAVGTAVLITKIAKACSEETKLNKALEEAEERYKKVTEEYAKTKDLYSNFLSAREALLGLEEGTIDFYNALVEANNKALELIDTLNLIAGKDYTIGPNGAIQIDDEALADAMYDEQRQVFRAQGAKFYAQYNMAEFERRGIVNSFQNEVTQKSPFGVGMDKQVAEDILRDALDFEKIDENTFVSKNNNLSGWSDVQAAFNDTRAKLDDVGYVFANMLAPLTTISHSIASEAWDQGLGKETAEITKEVGEFKTLYSQKSAEMLMLQRQAADSFIRAYADEATLDFYNNSTQQQQDYARDFTVQYMKAEQDRAATELDGSGGWWSFWDTSDKYGWEKVGIEVLRWILGGIETTFAQTDGTVWTTPQGWGKNPPTDLEIKEEYAKRVLGYTKDDSGQWRNTAGEKIDDKKIKDIDLDTAREAFLSGEYIVGETINEITKKIMASMEASAAKNFDTDSQEYISEGYIASILGDDTYNFKNLNDKEKAEVEQQIKDNTKGELSQEQKDFIKNMYSQTYDANIRAAEDLERFNDRLELESQQLETTSDALKLYALASEKAGTKTVQLSNKVAKNAAASYKFNKAYNEGRKTFEDSAEAWDSYINAIKNGEDISYDVADAAGEIVIALKDMGLELSNSQLTDPETLKKIKTIFTGTKEEAKTAFEELRDTAWIDNLIEKFGIVRDEAKDFVNTLKGLDVGDIFDISKAKLTQDTQDQLRSIQMTYEEWKQWAEQYGLEIKVKEPKFDVTKATFSTPPKVTRHVISEHKEGDTLIPEYSYTETEYPADETLYGIGDLQLTKKNDSGTNFTPKAPSGSSSKPKVEKLDEDPYDRYHDVNVELKQISNELDKIQKEQKYLTGSNLIANLQKQYNLLNRELDTTAEKLKIAKGEQEELQGKLSGSGVLFNSDGTIANYAEAWKANYAILEGIVNRYNSMSAKGQENYQSTLDQAKENWEKFKENISRYDELITDDIPGMESDIQEALDKQIEIKLEAFEYEIKLRLDMSEAERDWNKFKARIIDGIKEDDILGNAQANLKDFNSYYNEDGTGEIQATTNHINKILEQLRQMDADQVAGVYGKTYTYMNAQGKMVTLDYNNRNQALEDLKEYYSQLMDSMENLQDKIEEIHESYLDMMDEAQEKFDKQLETYENIGEIIEHDMNLTSLVFGEDAYGMLADFYASQRENNTQQLDFQRKQIDFWKQQMDAAEEGSEEWEKARENWEGAIDSWKETSEREIQTIVDEYLNAINLIFQELNNKVTDNKGLPYIAKEWELINKEADRYLDSINSIYAIQSLENKYDAAIEDAVNPTLQKKLNDLKEDELSILREKDKLSQYDIDRAELRYQIALKQMALEESQQKKTQLRLRRDSQGNYTYQYTADEDEISKMNQELSDLYNQLYNLDADQYKNNLNEMYQVWEEFQADMLEAAQINDPELRAQQELLIRETYGRMINDIVADNEWIQKNLHESTLSELFDLYDQNVINYEQMTQEQQEILDQFLNIDTANLTTAAYDNLFDIYNQNIDAFKNMTDEQLDNLISTFIPQFKSELQKMADFIGGNGGFIPVCQDALDEIGRLGNKYTEEISKAYEDYIKKSEQVKKETKDLVKDNNELINTYDIQLEAIKSVISELDKLIDFYDESAKAAKKAAEEAKNYWMEANKKNAEADTTIKDEPKPEVKQPEKKEEPKPSLTIGSRISVDPGTRWYSTSYGEGPSGTARGGTISYINTSGTHPYNIEGLGWIRKSDIVGYDTGGYTGEWNSTNGKLAMLHEKELVLNENDTKNILNAVEILRNITNNLGRALMNQMATISANGDAALMGNIASDELEQIVHIDAQFPNVTNSLEIEDALNNLVNRAAQHITKN